MRLLYCLFINGGLGLIKRVYILRGIPGSGKSSLAAHLAGEAGIVHSTDHYFYVDGKYCFDSSLLPRNHEKNFMAFCESLRKGVSVIVCDNTNIKRSHFTRYVVAAEAAGYQVDIVAIPHPDPEIAAARNKHGAPIERIRQMIADWED